jgi:hypothetical protein
MGKVLLEKSVEVDGYDAGPDVSPETSLEARRRASGRVDVRRPLIGRVPAALILGRRMADLGVVPRPGFVVNHRPAQTVVKQRATSYIFVPDGIENRL